MKMIVALFLHSTIPLFTELGIAVALPLTAEFDLIQMDNNIANFKSDLLLLYNLN